MLKSRKEADMAQQESSGNRLRDTPCIQSLLGFFFNKGVRGGPKIFLNLAAVLLGLLLVIKLMPQRLSDSALNSIPHDLWTGEAEETLQTDYGVDDDSIPGGLRIVVFGENDIGTPIGLDEEVEGAKSWTEALCVQVSGHDSLLAIIILGTYSKAFFPLLAGVLQAHLHGAIARLSCVVRQLQGAIRPWRGERTQRDGRKVQPWHGLLVPVDALRPQVADTRPEGPGRPFPRHAQATPCAQGDAVGL